METLDDLTNLVSQYLSDKKVADVQRGYYLAKKAHTGQFRSSGEEYITHPLSVAIILAQYYMEADVIIAALLHDVIEDTPVTKAEIAGEFSDEIAELVDGVSKLTQMKFSSKEEAKAENFQKMVLAMTKDIRVIVIKLVDRLHNMRTIGALRVDKKKRIAQETFDVYIPIAGILSMQIIKSELEELCFAAYYKLRYEKLTAAIEQRYNEQENKLQEIKALVSDELSKKLIDAELMIEHPTSWQIYSEMKKSHKNFDSITSILNLRISVADKLECYSVLGVLHSIYNPQPGKFKDHIAIPMSNGYQALQSIMVLPKSKYSLKVEIMSKDMAIMADYGITSYWLYDAGMSASPLAIGTHKRAQMWLDNLNAIKQFSDDSQEFTRAVKSGLIHTGEIYIFTRGGDILELPRGATAVDAAYKIHTHIGNSCVACKIDGELAALSQPLKTGQRIEILTSKDAQPNLAWQAFVITAKAKSAIKDFEKKRTKNQVLSLGRNLLKNALLSFNLDLSEFEINYAEKFLNLYEGLNFEDLLFQIGSGKRTAFSVADLYQKTFDDQISHKKSILPLGLSDAKGIGYAYAKCCQPIPGDAIVGHLNFGGIIIHRNICKDLGVLKKDPASCLPLMWGELPEDLQNRDFFVKLEVETKKMLDPVRELANLIVESGSHIFAFNTYKLTDATNIYTFFIRVKNRVHLANVIRKLKKVKKVNRISRCS